MKKLFKKILSAAVCVILIIATCLYSFAYTHRSPTASLVISSEAVPVGESISGAVVFYSANGFGRVILNENNFKISGTGKVELSDFKTNYSDGLTVTVGFKVTATYPGQVKINLMPDSVFDLAGMPNTTNTVPKFVDIKIFNTEGENANIKMTDREYIFTLIVAPFWYVLHQIGLV